MKVDDKDALPSLDQFKGQTLRAFLEALIDWLRRYTERPDAKGKPTRILAYTGGSGISARSGTTAGSGTCNVVTWNGTALSNSSSNGTFTAYNAYGTAFDANKYVWCTLWKGVYFAEQQEC